MNEKQAGIYILLTQNPELRIQEIANLAKIPRTSVYENLKSLEKMGLTERVVGDNFIRLRAYPLDGLRQNLEQKKDELDELTSELDELEKALASALDNKPQGTTEVRYYKGPAGARQLLWNTLKAKTTVYVYSSWGRGKYVGIKFYRNFVDESATRIIKERVLINPDPETLASIKQHLGSPLSRTKLEDIRMLPKNSVHIKGETFIYDDIYTQVYLKDAQINGFEIQSSQFTDTQRSIFRTLWEAGEPIDGLINS